MVHKIDLLRETLLANYYEDFTDLHRDMMLRASKGYYDIEVQYRKTLEKKHMVDRFHNYLVDKGYSVLCGTIEGFPFIEVHWK